MLHVIHEVDRKRVLGAGIQGSKDPRNAVGRNDLGLLETGIEHQLPHIFGALAVVDVHVGDGRQLDPVAQPFDRGGMVGADRRDNLVAAGVTRFTSDGRAKACGEDRGGENRVVKLHDWTPEPEKH